MASSSGIGNIAGQFISGYLTGNSGSGGSSGTSESSGGSSSDKTKKFIDAMLRSSFDTLIKGAMDGQRKAIEKNTHASGAWKAVSMPIPEVPVDLYADPNKKE